MQGGGVRGGTEGDKWDAMQEREEESKRLVTKRVKQQHLKRVGRQVSITRVFPSGQHRWASYQVCFSLIPSTSPSCSSSPSPPAHCPYSFLTLPSLSFYLFYFPSLFIIVFCQLSFFLFLCDPFYLSLSLSLSFSCPFQIVHYSYSSLSFIPSPPVHLALHVHNPSASNPLLSLILSFLSPLQPLIS